MNQYSEQNTLRLAKRFHNTKRTYLLVNPLQGKHIPVSPRAALAMSRTLGQKLAERYPGARLIIGFAETATAVGALAAECFPDGCRYIHTTRETLPGEEEWLFFQEEHSHAVDQKILAGPMGQWISDSDTIILIDDEISTGKTLINIIHQLRRAFPQMAGKQLVAASLLNRVSQENLDALAASGVAWECLVRLPNEDYTARMAPITIREAAPAVPVKLTCTREPFPQGLLPDPRIGVCMGRYRQHCLGMADAFLERYGQHFLPGSSVLVLGTEECMYPGLLLGDLLETARPDLTVRYHATTRSPIGISTQEGYPIFSGSKLPSFYESGRSTYVYDLEEYDHVIVVTDTQIPGIDALEALAGALPGRSSISFLQGGYICRCEKGATL